METKEKLQARTKRVDDAIALREPDRVPVAPWPQTYPFLHAGYSMADVMYDTEKAKESVRKYLAEYEPDLAHGYDLAFCGQGPMMEKIGINWLQWAGRPGTVVDKDSIHQFIEKPYLQDDEYPDLLGDMSGWVMRKWLPRCFSTMETFVNLDFRTALGYGYLPAMMQFSDPKVLEAFRTMADVGEMAAAYYGGVAEFEKEIEAMGYPVISCATATCAFDLLSDTLRGTLDILADLYEQPEYVKQAVEQFYPLGLNSALGQAEHSIGKFVFIPLHKGMDGFMGPDQYREFYWPTLERLVVDLVDRGYTPLVYTEGKYNSRLDFLKDLPKGKVLIHFEDADMKEAKRVVGQNCCISGGFRSKLLDEGTPEMVRDAVKRLLDICAPGGGFIFDLSDTMDRAKPENVEAMFDEVKTYGVYR